jgi:hypothetical protein
LTIWLERTHGPAIFAVAAVFNAGITGGLVLQRHVHVAAAAVMVKA